MLKDPCIWPGDSLLVPTKLGHFMWGKEEGQCAFSKRWDFSGEKKVLSTM